MKVYALKTHEPIVTAMWATDEPPTLYASREAAEVAAKEYNEIFHDEEPATVVEIEVLRGEPESVVNTIGPNYRTPEEVAAFLSLPLEASDEAA